MVTKNDNFMANWSLIIDRIISNVDNKSKNVLIQAGHFSILFNQNGRLIPAIKDDIQDESLRNFVTESNYMNDFPLVTFANGINLASVLRSHSINVKFAFIVNDWQWINKGLYSFKTDRFKFYMKKVLPKAYLDIFNNFKFSLNDVLRINHFVDKGIYFSEHKLRKVGKKKSSNCSPNSCAIEYLPFLNETLNDFDTLISFIPMSCKIPVLYATIRFLESQSKVIDLYHVFYDPTSKETELSFLNKKNMEPSYIDKIEEKYRIMELMSK